MTMANRGKDMMNRLNLPEQFRTKLFQYAVIMTTKLDMLMIVEVEGSRAMEFMYCAGSVLRFVKYLRTWGETGTITSKPDSTLKRRDRDIYCMFVRCAEEYAGNCC